MTRKTIVLPEDLFEKSREIISSETGLVFSRNRELELRQVLIESFQASGKYQTMDDYLAHLESALDSHLEMKRLVSRLTVGETYFFRNKPHFDLLREKMIPELIRKRSRTTRTNRMWSAGCSTGEEAYSLAILLKEALSDLSRWNVFILGTDINEESLELADRGEYREWSFREINPILKDRYFTQTGGQYKIHPEIRKMVTFNYLNRIQDTYPFYSTGTNFMDVIMCRNVMMYFQPSLSMDITRRFHRSLNNGGFLIIGHTEHGAQVVPELRKVMLPDTIIYQKEEKGSSWEQGLRLRFRGSGALPPNVLPYSRSLRPGSVDEEYEKLKRLKPKKVKKETVIFEEGIKAFKEGRKTAAARKFREVLEVNPVNVRGSYMLALLEANQGHLKKAQEYCRRCIKHYPLSLEAHYLMAVIARETGDRFKEIEFLKKVVYINHNFVLGHYQLGIYYLKEGNLVLAGRSFQNALGLLEEWDVPDFIEGAEGMTVGRLRESINRYLEEIESEGNSTRTGGK
jgi:chemotaxis protein methyltransferase CheR